ncbi:hypothetical protein BJV74DRAFT_989918 [Russula compacta]|nr:hypothetical protein BJV74DRAFT_989918 [Russula compacta]
MRDCRHRGQIGTARPTQGLGNSGEAVVRRHSKGDETKDEGAFEKEKREEGVISKLAFRALTAQPGTFWTHREDGDYRNRCSSDTITISGRRLDLQKVNPDSDGPLKKMPRRVGNTSIALSPRCKNDLDNRRGKRDVGPIEPPFCASDELVELWNMEHKVHEEILGGIDSGNEVFQVFANALEFKDGNCGEDGARWLSFGCRGWPESAVIPLDNIVELLSRYGFR